MSHCNECLVSIESGVYCKLCAPYMEEPAMEVAMHFRVKPEVSMVERLNVLFPVRERLSKEDALEYVRTWRTLLNDRTVRRAAAKTSVSETVVVDTTISFSVWGKRFELAKFNTRTLLKLLRDEGYLPKESAGKTNVVRTNDDLISVYYRETLLEVNLNLNKEVCMENVTSFHDIHDSELYTLHSNFCDMADHIRLYGKEIKTDEGYETVLETDDGHEVCFRYDRNGHELGAKDVLNKPVRAVYYPSELREFEADCDAGSWLSPASLMVHASELESLFVRDYNDSYVELVHYYANVFTRKNTITEDEALDNFMGALERLEVASTLEEVLALGKEIWSAQDATEYSRMYYFPKSGSKYFWDLYTNKREALGGVIMQNFVDRLSTVTTLPELYALKDEVINAPHSEAKSAFWSKYYDRKEALKPVASAADSDLLAALLARLEACTDVVSLAKLRKEVIEIPDFNGKKDFWTAYYPKSQALYAARNEITCRKFRQICEHILEYSSPAMLYRVRQELNNTYFPLEVKQVLHAKIDQKISEGTVSINVSAGVSFLMEKLTKRA